MSDEADSRPKQGTARPVWRVAAPLAAVLCGTIFATSYLQADGTDLRGGRFTDLASVVKAERATTNRLTGEAAALTAEVDRLSAGLGDQTVDRYAKKVEELAGTAGLSEVTGPAVMVTLSDAPSDVVAADGDVAELVVHQQDIQAVANAMWRGGAEAVVIQGQRVISTTGIKCAGNSVTLHGVPYSPPYYIVAIGDPIAITTEIDNDPYLDLYRQDAASPTGGVGWLMESLDGSTAPAYEGLLDLTYAKPLKS